VISETGSVSQAVQGDLPAGHVF